MKNLRFLVIFSIFGLLGCNSDKSGIPVLIYNENGKPQQHYIPIDEYMRSFADISQSVSDSVIEATSKHKPTTDYTLNSLSLGLGFEARVGIPVLVTLGSSGRVRLFFSKNGEPDIPSKSVVASPINKNFEAIQDPLEKITRVNTEILDTKFPNGIAGWQLTNLTTDVGVTSKSIFGLLPLNGTAGVTLHWGRVGAKKSESTFSGLEVELSEVNKEENNTKLNSIMNVAIATGKIKNIKAFKKNFSQFVGDFLEVAETLVANPHPFWSVSQFYVDRTIAGNGAFVGPTNAGGAVRLRISWKPGTKSTKKNEQMEDLVRYLADDLTVVAAEMPVGSEFTAERFRIGVGVSPKLGFGIIPVSTEAIGHLVLARTNTPFPENVQNYESDQGQILLLKKKDLVNSLAEKLDRKKLRNGLREAFKFSKKVAEHVQLTGKYWQVDRLDTSFDMGVKGNLQLTILNGIASAAVTFQRQ